MKAIDPTQLDGGPFTHSIERLVQLSIEGYYNPYREFEWPDELPEDAWWMSPHLLTVAGTQLEAELSEEQRKRLSKWESIYFYSLNVHGIRELLMEVIHRIHTPGHEETSEFLHHFIGEENEHMWFFARFCLNYGGKIYPDVRIKTPQEQAPEIADFLVFARITIFEEIVDYFNSAMGKDPLLHPTIRQINHMHHIDESRHVAFGRKLLSRMYRKLRDTRESEELRQIEHYLTRYLTASVNQLYSPAVYRDAGLARPLEIRKRLVGSPERAVVEQKITRRTVDFLVKEGIFANKEKFVQ